MSALGGHMATRRAPAPTTRAGRGGSKSTVTGKMCVCGCTAANKHPEGFVFFKQHIDYETRVLEDNGLCARVLAPPEDRQGVLKERVEEE